MVAALVAGLFASWLSSPRPGDAAALGTALRGAAAVTTTPVDGTEPAAGSAAAAAASSPTLQATPAEPPAPGPTGATPTELTIAAAGLRMPVVPVGVAADGEMALPPTPARAGWYRYGALPGDPQGAVVIAGHLDQPWYGTGPLARLNDVSPGASVVVRTGATSRRYVVTEVQRVRKTRLDLATLFRVDGPPSLHIVTCGGRFDPVARRYDENVVLVARPV
ncbi:peptidase C60 [Intrasporangium chromatireducens Q5-1]|uniref:Peptidase C60 n=1 Tax=Intrasporangium chromatireducens Q5-1 TaxID=584657 RepID=W9GFN1_9MICO|nr:peptidase C60 [Intrasporangium chromatireducens Q5-1]